MNQSEIVEAATDYESPQIKNVKPSDGDYELDIRWSDGSSSRVDLTEPIFGLKYLRPLRDRELFRKVKTSDWGWAVSWGNDLDFSAENLWWLAKKQEAAEVTPGRFRNWLKRNHLTQEKAAQLLGISKRSVSYYATGALPVTRHTSLAMKGLEAELYGENLKSVDRERRSGMSKSHGRAPAPANKTIERQR